MQGLDFASAIQQVLSAAEPAPRGSQQVDIEEIDHTLDCVASICEFSSPNIRSRFLYRQGEATTELTRLFRKIDSIQTKWLVRLILKDLQPAIIPEMTVLRTFHVRLPVCLAVRSSLADALLLLEDSMIHGTPLCSSLTIDKIIETSVLAEIMPQLGVIIGLPRFKKARSITYYCHLIGK